MELLTWFLSVPIWESFFPSSPLPPLRNCICLDLWFLCQVWLISSFNYFSRFLSILLSLGLEQLFPFFLSLYITFGDSKKHLIILCSCFIALASTVQTSVRARLRNGHAHMRSQTCGLAEVIRSMWAVTELSKCDTWTFSYYLCPIIAKRGSQEENMKKTWGFFSFWKVTVIFFVSVLMVVMYFPVLSQTILGQLGGSDGFSSFCPEVLAIFHSEICFLQCLHIYCIPLLQNRISFSTLYWEPGNVCERWCCSWICLLKQVAHCRAVLDFQDLHKFLRGCLVQSSCRSVPAVLLQSLKLQLLLHYNVSLRCSLRIALL